MLVDITDYLDVPARNEALEKLDLLDRFENLKKNGQLIEAANLLENSCKDPHIFHGHYKRLFMVWRQLNKEDLIACNYKAVIERVIKTISVHDKFHRTLILSGFCFLKIAKISLNSSFFPKPIKR